MAPSTDTRGGGQFSLWCLAEAAEVLSKQLCVLMDLPLPVLCLRDFLGAIVCACQQFAARFLRRPMWEVCGRQEGPPFLYVYLSTESQVHFIGPVQVPATPFSFKYLSSEMASSLHTFILCIVCTSHMAGYSLTS